METYNVDKIERRVIERPLNKRAVKWTKRKLESQGR